jgi:hypothetical protein
VTIAASTASREFAGANELADRARGNAQNFGSLRDAVKPVGIYGRGGHVVFISEHFRKIKHISAYFCTFRQFQELFFHKVNEIIDLCAMRV